MTRHYLHSTTPVLGLIPQLVILRSLAPLISGTMGGGQTMIRLCCLIVIHLRKAGDDEEGAPGSWLGTAAPGIHMSGRVIVHLSSQADVKTAVETLHGRALV